jgi:hypothetical protein
VKREPALRFWLRYVEREGALVDPSGDAPLVVLTPELQRRLELSETVAVTSDPDVAREDGAVLLAPGHPLLDSAAARVLEEGDAGTICLEWPTRPPLTGDQLLALARDRVGVDHGRIDPGGPPQSRYAPVLRVAVQVTYVVSDHFHEREEVWVDARSGLPVPADVVRQVEVAPRLAADARPDRPSLEVDMAAAVAAAHGLLDERAAARRSVLARQSAAALREELAQAERFYDASLESIAQRGEAAPADRRRLYDDRAQATRAERARRLEEIREKYAARQEIRPVRLHVVLLPALHLPLVVRRGARTFPFALTWWLPAARFADVRCPGCGATSQLVAAKDRLGCRSCVEVRVAEPTRQEPPAPGSRPAPPAAPPAPSKSAVPAPGKPPAPPPVERDPAELVAEWQRDYARLRGRVQRAGRDLGHRLWQSVLNGDAWPRKRSDPHSPLRVVHRLYGVEGPLRAIGVPLGAQPDETTTVTEDPQLGLPHRTFGTVVAGARPYQFSLAWRLEDGKPLLLEVVPFRWMSHGELGQAWTLPAPVAGLLYLRVPAPLIELDPVAELLWRKDLSLHGLPVVARCLAAWWRVVGDPALPAHSPETLAAALAAMVGRRAGASRTRPAAAGTYGADPAEVGAAARRMQSLLGLSDSRWW